MSKFTIRLARLGDQQGAYYVCLKTGDHGKDGEPFYREDPDALGRIFVGPYLAFEPEMSLILEDEQGICGYENVNGRQLQTNDCGSGTAHSKQLR